MTHDNDSTNGATFPMAMGSLERAIEMEDEQFIHSVAGDEVDRPTDDDDPMELDRMLIRLGGNGF